MKQPLGVVRLLIENTGETGLFQILTSTKTTRVRYRDEETTTIILRGNTHGDVVLERLDAPEESRP